MRSGVGTAEIAKCFWNQRLQGGLLNRQIGGSCRGNRAELREKLLRHLTPRRLVAPFSGPIVTGPASPNHHAILVATRGSNSSFQQSATRQVIPRRVLELWYCDHRKTSTGFLSASRPASVIWAIAIFTHDHRHRIDMSLEASEAWPEEPHDSVGRQRMLDLFPMNMLRRLQ